MAGNVGQELIDKVADGRAGHRDAVAGHTRFHIGFPARHVKIADLVVNAKPHQVGVVGHALAIVSLGPDHLRHGVQHAPGNLRLGHPVVVRVLVCDGGDEEGAEELAGQILCKTHAHIAPVSCHSGPVRGVRVVTH